MVWWSGFYNAPAQEANQWEQCIESFEYTSFFVWVWFFLWIHDPSTHIVTQSNSNLTDSVPSSTPNLHTRSLRQLPSTQTWSGISSFLRMTSLTPAKCRVRDDMPQSLSPCPSHTYKTPVLSFGLFRIERTWTSGLLSSGRL
jgi:hypothetical protein